MRAEAVNKGKTAPYLFSYYNVSTFSSSDKEIRNPMVRMLNNIIESLNKYHVIPRFVVLIPDWDLVRFLNFREFGINHIIGVCVKWWVEEKIMQSQRKSKKCAQDVQALLQLLNQKSYG